MKNRTTLCMEILRVILTIMVMVTEIMMNNIIVVFEMTKIVDMRGLD